MPADVVVGDSLLREEAMRRAVLVFGFSIFALAVPHIGYADGLTPPNVGDGCNRSISTGLCTIEPKGLGKLLLDFAVSGRLMQPHTEISAK